MNKNGTKLNETQLCSIDEGSKKGVLKEGCATETPQNVMGVLSRGPIKEYVVSANGDGLIYVKASTNDCNQLKYYMKTNGYSCVNDCTLVEQNGTLSGDRLLTFHRWGGFHNPLENK